MKVNQICIRRYKKSTKGKYSTKNRFYLLITKSNFFKKVIILTWKLYIKAKSKTQFIYPSLALKFFLTKKLKLQINLFKFMQINKIFVLFRTLTNLWTNIHNLKKICRNSFKCSCKKQKLQKKLRPHSLKKFLTV